MDNQDFCGCTWGAVRFRGRPVPGAAITLTVSGGGAVTGTTRENEVEPMPYYDVTAHDLGARRGDILTLAVRFAGQTVSRVIRAWPDAYGEQRVDLVFPERGTWTPWIDGGYTRTLAVAGELVWAGGPAGVISAGLTSGVSVTQLLPWANPAVRTLVVDNDGHVWAAGDEGLAEFDGNSWQTHTIPLSDTLRALAVDRGSGAIWLGDGDGAEGHVARYSGSWQMAGRFDAPVMALAVDGMGRAWAGTWGLGAYRQDGAGGWVRYRAADGLASDNVLSAAATEDGVWFGTFPYLTGDGTRGGVAHYRLASGTWRAYTTVHGLPAVPLGGHTASAPVYALSSAGDRTIWAGTEVGVSFLADDGWWGGYTATHGLRAGPVFAISAAGESAIAAPSGGLDRLDPSAPIGVAPVAQIDTVDPSTLTLGTSLLLDGTGLDGDGGAIAAWAWSSSLDGPLCTAPSCQLPYDLFSPGGHTITLRVQDDEGMWSLPASSTMMVEEANHVFLPLAISND
jgi:hypothetical protein